MRAGVNVLLDAERQIGQGAHFRRHERWLVAYCTFIDPPLERVGSSERQGRDNGLPVRMAKLPVREVFRTRTTSSSTAFMKALHGRVTLPFSTRDVEYDNAVALREFSTPAEIALDNPARRK